MKKQDRTRMKLIFAAALLMAASPMWAGPQTEKHDFKATETQTLRLKVKQLEFLSAQEHFQSAIAAFNAEVSAVEKENDWPADLQFHADTLAFTESPKAPVSAHPNAKPDAPAPIPAPTKKP